MPIQRVRDHATAASHNAVFARASSRAPTDAVVYDLDLRVENDGDAPGATSVLLYAAPPPGAQGPRKTLIAFDKVHLAPGEAKTITLHVRAHDLTVAQDRGGRAPIPGPWTLLVMDQTAVLTVE